MANNIELLHREDAKDTKEEPPPPKAVSLSKKPGFCRDSAPVSTPHQRRDPLALQR
jgi:hypothetical protein